MMRSFALLATVVCPSIAFRVHPTGSSLRVVALRGKGEHHLQELASQWESLLEARGNEFAKSPDASKVGELTTQFLQTAIDHAQSAQEEEVGHAIQAHRELERALQLEDSLTMAQPLFHDDATRWMEPFCFSTRLAEDGSLLPEQIYQYLVTDQEPLDRQTVKQMAKEYQDSLRKELQWQANLASEEEGDAKRTLEELKRNEEILKETLKDFELKERLEKVTTLNGKEMVNGMAKLGNSLEP